MSKKVNEKVYHRSREWLNPIAHGNAYIYTEVAMEEWEYSGEERDTSFNVEFELTDCRRKVSLDFHIHGDGGESFDRVLEKVDLLHREVSAFRKAMHRAIADEKKRRRAKKK